MIKLGRIRWLVHVPRLGREEVYAMFWWGNLRERDHVEDPQAKMGGFGGKSVYMSAYFAFVACNKSGCGKIHLNNAQKPVQSCSNISSTMI
jgi:hypothetical protein